MGAVFRTIRLEEQHLLVVEEKEYFCMDISVVKYSEN